MQKNVIFRAEITQNHPGGQKMRFFKLQDIDTIIEPGKRNINDKPMLVRPQKGLVTTQADFEILQNFGLPHSILGL